MEAEQPVAAASTARSAPNGAAPIQRTAVKLAAGDAPPDDGVVDAHVAPSSTRIIAGARIEPTANSSEAALQEDLFPRRRSAHDQGPDRAPR